MPAKNRRTVIKFPIFHYQVTVIVARDLVRTGHKLGGDLKGSSAAFVYKEDGTPQGWLVLGYEASPGTIAHEASHCVRHMLTVAGVSLDDETFSYHLGHLVDLIHKFIGKSG